MILFLAGTSDARALAVALKNAGHRVLATVVTESAAESLQQEDIDAHVGRLNLEDMCACIKDYGITCVIDASHPYAEEASKTAMQAAQLSQLPYIRYERPQQQFTHPLVTAVTSYEEAAVAASTHTGTIMLTTGSKTLQIFTKYLHKESIRLVCRMLPNKDNMEKCAALGVKQRDIIAMQGPFSMALNKALYTQYDTTLVITKESGQVGAVDEKMEAAIALNIPVILITRPAIQYENQCTSFEQVFEKIGGITDGKFKF